MVQNKWRIGLTEGGLNWFISLNIPPPNVITVQEFQEQAFYSVGRTAVVGNPSILLTFNELTGTQLARLRNYYIDNARDNNVGVLYMTIDWAIGVQSGRHWVDVRGYVTPTTQQPASPIASGQLFTGVEFTLNNLVIVNDPAIF